MLCAHFRLYMLPTRNRDRDRDRDKIRLLSLQILEDGERLFVCVFA